MHSSREAPDGMLDLRKHFDTSGKSGVKFHYSEFCRTADGAARRALGVMPTRNPDRAAILITIAISIFPLAWSITVPLGILAYLWILYLKYLDAKNAATREQVSKCNAPPPS